MAFPWTLLFVYEVTQSSTTEAGFATTTAAVPAGATTISASSTRSQMNIAVVTSPTVTTAEAADWTFRLANGTSSSNGRLEVFLAGKWGQVCDYHFTNVEVGQLCTVLNKSKAGFPIYGSYFGKHPGAYILQYYNCLPDHSWCEAGHWVIGKCESIGMDCTDSLNFRLLDGSVLTEGRVEVLVAEEWGTVCAMDLHGSNTQDLLCQAVGYSSSSYVGSALTEFPTGRGPIWLQSVYCQPTSTSIMDCTLNRNPSCTHAFDASLFCQ